jgi:archaetidylinositol phosphate synthase
MNNKKTGEHERTSEFIFAPFERRVLPWLAARLPQWVLPDHLTLLGLAASTMIAIAYMLSNRNPLWLWGVSSALIIQWFGDSLDGNLARYRKIQRPRYGYYLDHLTDAYSTLAIGLGLGLSPYMLLSVGLAVVTAYLVLSINVYLETYVFNEFSFSYGRLGPTEVRVLLILLNTAAFLVGPGQFTLWGVGMTAFDIVGALIAVGMLLLLLGRASGNLRKLAALEPPNVRKE